MSPWQVVRKGVCTLSLQWDSALAALSPLGVQLVWKLHFTESFNFYSRHSAACQHAATAFKELPSASFLGFHQALGASCSYIQSNLTHRSGVHGPIPIWCLDTTKPCVLSPTSGATSSLRVPCTPFLSSSCFHEGVLIFLIPT